MPSQNVEPFEPRRQEQFVALLRACNFDRRAVEVETHGRLNFEVLVAIEDDELTGFIHFQTTGTYSEQFGLDDHPEPQMWVFDMAVDPARRSSGVGALLLQGVARHAAALGRSYVALEVDFRGEFDRRVVFFKRNSLHWLDEAGRIMGAPIADVLTTRGEAS